jgi:hypothetical protein
MILLLYLSIPIGIDPVETNEALGSGFFSIGAELMDSLSEQDIRKGEYYTHKLTATDGIALLLNKV